MNVIPGFKGDVQTGLDKLFKEMGIDPLPVPTVGKDGTLNYDLKGEQAKAFVDAMKIPTISKDITKGLEGIKEEKGDNAISPHSTLGKKIQEQKNKQDPRKSGFEK